MIDTNKKYLFHNVYGEEAELINSATSDIEIVPFGWTAEAESNRNNILNQMQMGVSALPSVSFWRLEKFIPEEVMGDITIPSYTKPAQWVNVPVGTWPKEDWTWEKINQAILDLS